MSVSWCIGAGATDAGPRAVNEDSYVSAGCVHVVADGMGGHRGGAAASVAAIDAFARLTNHVTVSPGQVREAVARAQRAVDNVAERIGGDPGTTLTGAIAVEHLGEPWWMVINVGDSRVYALEGGTLRQVTVDHSHVQQLVDAGEITAEQALIHPERNVVTRAIGDGLDGFDAWLVPARPGLRLVIASDGLTKALADARIASIGSLAGGADEAATRLLEAALAAPATDNVTVVVADTLMARTDPDAEAAPWVRWDADEEDETTTVTSRRREST